MFRLSKLKFTTWLGIVSVLGFLTIFLKTISSIDLSPLSDSLLFIIIGLALFLAGGTNFFMYFEDGKLTPAEINRLVTMLIGIASMITGLVMSPFIGYEVAVIEGIKAVISLIAISVIIIEIINNEKKK